jgi:hypothetical protein
MGQKTGKQPGLSFFADTLRENQGFICGWPGAEESEHQETA